MEIPGLGLAKSAVSWAVDSAVTVASVPSRVAGLLDEVESLVQRVNKVVTNADELVNRTAHIVDDAEKTVDEVRALTAAAGEVADGASRVVHIADGTARTANELITLYEPVAKTAHPLATRFVEELSPHEIEAAIRLVDELPALTDRLVTDILPILETLNRVGPDVHQLLEVTNDVRQAILGIPGFGFMRRRGETKEIENNDD
ncbi:ribulose 1,5-bisphosphate carboxylase large subunit [Lentzea tibetensis]|uniref:Ribulose 1,5-bisphosphate carboxylase large subunit n=1 Tax=Lentzea tibetensis TaxID=2591470 RepID=A0A563ETF8_9PSEU|nr:ribulose 1,5-bisphosphate carboxylase large subunit [Lentzea tibetensis]TWP51007.1 ribulose 1,5-bisphosphate carboxylase large subunit [Lentzea tibetensis]